MIKSIDKTRVLNVALAAAVALSFAASTYSAAEATENKPQPVKVVKPQDGNGGGTSAASDTSDWPVVHRGKIKKVTVKTEGGTGCHDHENQVSTPGPC